MYYYLKGKVSHIAQNLAVIDVGGVGYACNTSLYTLSRIKTGEDATIYTYLHVREDVMDLYGFADQEELACFKMLLGISGVGPKAALSILSAVSPSDLALSVVTGDEKPLTAASGVGKKLAQRIILELKDKIAKQQMDLSAGSDSIGIEYVTSDASNEAAAALAVLGYSQAEIGAALKGMDIKGMSVEEIIKKALTNLIK